MNNNECFAAMVFPAIMALEKRYFVQENASISTGILGWACLLSLAWLVPNHYVPWIAFHSDAWTAFLCGLVVFAILFLVKRPVVWPKISILVLALVIIPILQFAGNLLPFAGQMWTSSVYLLGLLLAILGGLRWEKERPEQLTNALFLAIGIAAVLSVGLQLHQCFNLEGFEILVLELSGKRPYANLAQPNQLATLLLLGLLGCAWGFQKNKIGALPAILMAAFLLLGVALTQSRTAWIGLIIILGWTWLLRDRWSSKSVPWVVTALCVYFVSCSALIPWLDGAAQIGSMESRSVGIKQNDPRLVGWSLLIDAALQRPWFGYGWTEVGHAQLAMALEYPALATTFQHAHNLLIDLILWCGIPAGLSIFLAIVWWFVRRVRAAYTVEDTILLMFVVVLGNHAMLELPLQYAYFLLPLGLIIGTIEARLSSNRAAFIAPRWTMMAVWTFAAVLFFFLVRDYMRVEENYYALRFERANIGTLPKREPPEVVLLTQLREELRFGRYEPTKGVDHKELKWARDAAYLSPGISEFYRLAKTLALNERPHEAQQELSKLCKIVPQRKCDLVKRVWEHDSLHSEEIAAVKWPLQ